MARIVLVLIFMLFAPNIARTEVVLPAQAISMSTLVTVQDVPFEQCTAVFKMDAESLFYLTLASVNANRFSIEEIQSKNGYVLFKAVGKSFLASVVKLDGGTSLLKITPTNNVYYFQPGIVLNIFNYIALNNALRPVTIIVN